MTDKFDNADEEQPIPGIAAFSEESMDDGGDDDNYEDDDELSDEGDSDDLNSLNEELTPNDIFGLDPLDVLTLEELADYLKVSVGAVRRAVKEQQLPGRNIGGDWRFLRDAVANWLRGQQEPVQQQQRARKEYSSSQSSGTPESVSDQYSQGGSQSYDSGESGGDFRSRKRYSEGGYQGQGGGQYGNRGGQYSNQDQYGGGTSYGERRPPRRPYRANEGGGYGSYGGGGGGGGGYRGGNQYGGGSGGYSGGGQQYGGGYKKKNKRQVFDNERGKRLDRRKENEGSDDQQS